MKCRWCGGTGDRSGHGECEHCNSTGIQADPPFGQDIRTFEQMPRSFYENIMEALERRVTTPPRTCTGPDDWYEHKKSLILAINDIISNVKLPDEEVEELARYWSDSTCDDTYGDMMVRIYYRVMEHL